MTVSEKKYILCIDHGTGGPKCAIASTHGDILEWAFEPVAIHAIKGGGVEQDPDKWWNAIIKASTKVIDSGCVPVEDIVAVSNSSQWSGTVPVDKDGNHLHNAIIWMDTRGAKHVKKAFKGLINVSGYSVFKILKWLKLTGGAPALSGKGPIGHILWLKNERPEIVKKTYKYLEPQDFINLKLTGKFAASIASIQLHWVTDNRDPNNVVYSQKLIKKLKLDPNKLPDLKLSTDVLGTLTPNVADQLGLEKSTKVVLGAQDVMSAPIGSGAVGDYEGHIYIGTSDWLECHVPYQKVDINHMMASVPSAIPGRYLLLNEQEVAGGALNFLRDNILYHKDELLREEAKPDVYKIFDQIVDQVPAGANNLIFTPWLIGERTPIESDTIRGGLYNLSLEMTREHILRAIFEGVAFNVRWLFMYVEKFIEKWVRKERPGFKKGDLIMPELNIIGGGGSSDVWCQIFADVLNRKINQVKDPIQANARGAAYIASVGLGYIDWDHIAKHTEIAKTFTPNSENRETYDGLFKEYLTIYKNMKKQYKRLNESH
ncbi:MAG: xylulose kinase [Candidatus Lokiarchaeota archaeon]|nr:xylulose kinase [Candidatus Lokiarchaeota archaeon]MBD3340996.1 xylulose kinase [Candidatus Lokiarchaeota archaeon]